MKKISEIVEEYMDIRLESSEEPLLKYFSDKEACDKFHNKLYNLLKRLNDGIKHISIIVEYQIERMVEPYLKEIVEIVSNKSAERGIINIQNINIEKELEEIS